MRERRGSQAVDAVLYGLVVAGDDATLEIRVALHIDLEPAVARLDSGLFGHTGIVALQLVLAEVRRRAGGSVAYRRHAYAHRHATAGLLRVEVADILQALNVQIPADIRNNLLTVRHGALEVCVATGLQRQRVARIDVRIGPRCITAVAVTPGARHPHLKRDPVRFSDAERHADTRARSAVRALLAVGILCRLQVDIALSVQRGVVACRDVAAGHVDVAGCARTGCGDAHVVAGGYRTACRCTG
ncbi:hypothetical protein R75465_08594 [Paraburkholderia aspalathi]|nr:hypothetical protein R75465_08594 [Paraburkholderia aspalathi]